MSQVLTIVIPLRIDSAGTRQTDLDRFALLLWPSFRAFWRSPQHLRWLMVCPAEDLAAVKARLASLPGAEVIDVITEDELLPGLIGKRGWHKQQLVKLAAAQRVTTEYYLTLDADILLLRSTGVADLLPDGKPLLGDRRGVDHPDWWAGSARMLQTDLKIAPDTAVMGVTPALLQTALTQQLLGEVARRNGVDDGARFLFESRRERWTEYTLYWLYALECGVDALYCNDGRPLYKGVFEAGDSDRLQPAWLQQEYTRPDGPMFCVVQSKRDHAISEVAWAVRFLLDLPQARTHDSGLIGKLKEALLQ